MSTHRQLATLLFTTIAFAGGNVSAHSGGLDANGCHAGSQPYHCHRSTGTSTSTTTTSSYTSGVQAGRSQCISSPASCGINVGYSQDELNTAAAGGREACRNDPGSCGIDVGYSQNQLDAAAADARTACRNSPGSCGIDIGFSQDQMDAAATEARNECRSDPSGCGITATAACVGPTTTMAPAATFNAATEFLDIPRVEVATSTDTSANYRVIMRSISPTHSRFEVDQVLPVEE